MNQLGYAIIQQDEGNYKEMDTKKLVNALEGLRLTILLLEKILFRFLLNKPKGLRSYEEIQTINGVLYPTFKDAFHVLGLLNYDREWNDVIVEADQWAFPSKLRELFVTISIMLWGY